MRRRDLLKLAPLSLLVPRLGRAGSEDVERKFLFIHAYGGWDTIMAFTPAFGVAGVDTDAGSTTAEAKGITFVDNENRPAVRSFFERYGDRSCLINGMEVRSVTHERSQRILLTGSSSDAQDWGVRVAASSSVRYPAPYLVISGAAFAGEDGYNVVRKGDSGQLLSLVRGETFGASDMRVTPPSSESRAAVGALLSARLNRMAAASDPAEARYLDLYRRSLEDAATLESAAGTVNLDVETDGCRRDTASDAISALGAFEAGLSRCAFLRDVGWCEMSWDTHSANDDMQARNYEALFAYLQEIMVDLDARAGTGGGSLADETTIVVLSEMGRHPKRSGDGRGHWTTTSALLIGAGVRGGQVIGGLNDQMLGQPVDLVSGEVTDSGTALLPVHLGATLLAMAGIDPEEELPGVDPIYAATTDLG